MHHSNKDGKASKPHAKRVKAATTGGALAARMFRTVPASPFLNPKLVTKLRYSQVVSHNNGVADAGMYQFRLNSPYDPDYTGGGSQPPFYDRMAGLYNTYRVLSAKYRIKSSYLSGTVQSLVVWTSTTATAVSSLQSALSQLDSHNITMCSFSDPDSNCIQRWLPMEKAFGVEKAEIETDSDYGANSGANPTKISYLNLYSGNLTGTTTSTAASIVEITYYVEWCNPIPDNMN